MAEKYKKAVEFARECHAGQVRKYTGEPYIEHCLAVADLVREVTDDEDVLCAAVLHDTVEDTPATLEDIGWEFGGIVRSMVYFLTDEGGPENRATRKNAYKRKLEAAAADTQTVKLADLIDNTRTIVKHDPKFAKVYMAEKRDLLEVLKNGNPILHAKAQKLVDDYFLNPNG